MKQGRSRLASVKGSTLPAGRLLLPRELQRLFETCDDTPRGRRDAAILTVMRAGLRRSEIVTLDLDDYDGERATVTVRHGKGDKDRLVALNTGADDCSRINQRSISWVFKKADFELSVRTATSMGLTSVHDASVNDEDIAILQRALGRR